MNWEFFPQDSMKRAKVPGGWLVVLEYDVRRYYPDQGYISGYDWRPTITFVPDPNYEWEIN